MQRRETMGRFEMRDERLQICKDIGDAIQEKDLGRLVGLHEKQLFLYYEDARNQAWWSFLTAMLVAIIGFVILIIAIIAIVKGWNGTAVLLSTIGAVLAQFISATVFWLYSRTAQQFATFHNILERSCRYLLGYLIADTTKLESHDHILRDLVCIMASAPMINSTDHKAFSIFGEHKKRGSASSAMSAAEAALPPAA
jgi:hypothetical protein